MRLGSGEVEVWGAARLGGGRGSERSAECGKQAAGIRHGAGLGKRGEFTLCNLPLNKKYESFSTRG